MAANLPRKHHFLPAFYTRWWCNESGYMFRFSRVHGNRIEQRRATPGAIGFDIDLYTLPEYSDELNRFLETEIFNYIDHYGAAAVEQLCCGKTPFTPESRTALAMFLQSLCWRTPSALAADEDRISDELGLDAIVRTSDRNDEVLRLLSLLRLSHVTEPSPFGLSLINMSWHVIDVDAGGVFLMTSDSPVIILPQDPTPTGSAAMPKSDIRSVVVPISPSKFFATNWPSQSPIALTTMSPQAAAKLINKTIVKQADTFILHNDDSHSAFIHKHFGGIH